MNGLGQGFRILIDESSTRPPSMGLPEACRCAGGALIERHLAAPDLTLNGLDLCEKLAGRALTAIPLDVAEGSQVPFGAVSGAGIGDQGDQIAQVACIPHRRTDALVRQQAADN